MGYLPIVLDLEGRGCVVVGDGPVAAEKAVQFADAGGRVFLIAPGPTGELRPELRELVSAGAAVHRRRYLSGDLDGSILVFAEPGARDLERIWRDAEAAGVAMNVMDDVPHCSYIVPAMVRRGDLLVAISTSGRAPALAARLRQELERRLGPQHARFLEIARRLRGPIARAVPDFPRRRELWYRLVDSDVLDLLAAGDEGAALRRVERIMGVAPEPVPEQTPDQRDSAAPDAEAEVAA